jgi:hypothetical protein
MSFQNRLAAATRRTATIEDETPEAQRRWAKRKPMHSTGQILFDGVTTPYCCIVRDISSTGVRLEMTKNKYNPDAASGFIPTYFTLTMPLDRTRVECQSMWRRGAFVGARFLGAVEHIAVVKRVPMMIKKTDGKK